MSDAEAWLQEHGLTDLWAPWQREMPIADIQAWYDDAFVVAGQLSRLRSWSVFGMSGSVLADHRFVYWDVVEGTRKWKMAGPVPPYNALEARVAD